MVDSNSDPLVRRVTPTNRRESEVLPVPDFSTYESEKVPPDSGDRLVAAFAYIGVVPFLLFAGSPGRRFVRRHQHVAATVHAIRVVWTAFVLVFWWGFIAAGEQDERQSALIRDLAMTVVAGFPWITSFQSDMLPWLLTPLVATWFLSIAGFILAIGGKTADFHAFIHADWSDVVRRRRWFSRSPEEERRIARLARERHLERIQSSTRTFASERLRRERLESIQNDIEQLRALRDHNDQLLALGEISQRRYNESLKGIDEDIAELDRIRSGLTQRIAASSTSFGQVPERMRASRTDRSSEALVDTVAIVTPSGIPLFTYGSFQLDEAIVAGILSAFDSLSEEVFGSRVHKTQLAEGQVLYFAHGLYVLILAVFDDEPSPRQIEQLKTMLRQFEQANQGYLQREQYDPAYLHQVEITFKFAKPIHPDTL
jgi:hypothetical protein